MKKSTNHSKIETGKPGGLIDAFVNQLPELRAHLDATISNHVKARFSLDDIIQETVRRAVEKQDSIEWTTRHSAQAWLRRTANRIVIDHIRKKQFKDLAVDSAGTILSGLIASRQLTPSREFSVSENARLLNIALSRLSDTHQQVLRLRYQDQLDFQAIAQVFGNTPSAIRGLHRNAIKILKRELGSGSLFFSG